MTSDIGKIIAEIKERKDKIGQQRDRLRVLHEDLGELIDNLNTGHEDLGCACDDLQRAIDVLSEQL